MKWTLLSVDDSFPLAWSCNSRCLKIAMASKILLSFTSKVHLGTGKIAALPLFFPIVSQVALPYSKLNFSLTLEQSDQCFQAMVISQGTKKSSPRAFPSLRLLLHLKSLPSLKLAEDDPFKPGLIQLSWCNIITPFEVGHGNEQFPWVEITNSCLFFLSGGMKIFRLWPQRGLL